MLNYNFPNTNGQQPTVYSWPVSTAVTTPHTMTDCYVMLVRTFLRMLFVFLQHSMLRSVDELTGGFKYLPATK